MIALRILLAMIAGLGVALLATSIASIATGAVSVDLTASLEAVPLLIGVVAGAVAAVAMWAVARRGRPVEKQPKQVQAGGTPAEDDSVESILEKYKL